MFLLSILGLMAFIGWLYLAFAHADFWMPLFPEETIPLKEWPSVDIIVPARNEAKTLPKTLPSVLSQNYSGEWRVILVDDHSTDGTKKIAADIAEGMNKADRLVIIQAPVLLKGWNGKVAAMNAGASQSNADMVLFTDADIYHPPHSLTDLVQSADFEKFDLVSRMVKLNCHNLVEKLLIPAFVFFFQMIYPFRRTNNPVSSAAAAAGGVMLVKKSMLDTIGGMEAIKSELIDDCNLAKAIKSADGRIQLTLSKQIESIRQYYDVSEVWKMIARCAYTQLNKSPILLAGTVLGMAILFVLPFLFMLFAPTVTAFITGALAFIIMYTLYLSTVKLYNLHWSWAFTLPVAALIYMGATIDSARLHYQGRGGQWKGRTQQQP